MQINKQIKKEGISTLYAELNIKLNLPIKTHLKCKQSFIDVLEDWDALSNFNRSELQNLFQYGNILSKEAVGEQ